jgi:hypothetical protein
MLEEKTNEPTSTTSKKGTVESPVESNKPTTHKHACPRQRKTTTQKEKKKKKKREKKTIFSPLTGRGAGAGRAPP